MPYKAILPTNNAVTAPTKNRVKKLLNQLAKEADKSGYAYLLLAFPEPAPGQMNMTADCAFRVGASPVNMGSLLFTLSNQQQPLKQVLQAVNEIARIQAATAQVEKAVKLIVE